MATGINVDKLNTLKVDILSYIESIRSLMERLDDCGSVIRTNLVGPGANEITGQVNGFLIQFSNACSNINSYIQLLNQIEKKFETNDSELAFELTNNIKKLEQ